MLLRSNSGCIPPVRTSFFILDGSWLASRQISKLLAQSICRSAVRFLLTFGQKLLLLADVALASQLQV